MEGAAVAQVCARFDIPAIPVDRNRVQELWDEIAGEVARMPLTESQRRRLDERLADEEHNPDDVESWAKAKDDILREP